MGLDISWQAFDVKEVERMWSEMPLGEVVEKVNDDSLFWSRKRDLMPDTKQKDRRLSSGFEYAEEFIERISDLGNNGMPLEHVIKNEGVKHFSAEELMYIDMDFINYWTYDWTGGRYFHYYVLTQAAYLRQGLQEIADDTPEESISGQWLEAMRKVDKETIAAVLIYGDKLMQFETFPSIKPKTLEKETEEIEYSLEELGWVIELFEFAKNNNLDIFVSSEADDFEEHGAGENKLLNRYKQRFGG